MSFNLKKWKELTPNERFDIPLILHLLVEDIGKKRKELTPEEKSKANKIYESNLNIIMNCVLLLMLG